MEFSVNTDTLKKEVNLLQSVTEKKSGIAVLANILIESTDTGIKLTASDLETTITVNMTADIKKEGSICVSAKKLCDIVKSLDSGVLKFKKQENDWVNLSCNTSKFRVAGIGTQQFPVIPEVEDNEVVIDGDALKALIAHTCFAVTTEESRFSLGGAKLEVSRGTVTMAATDGHRIAMMEDEIDDVEAELDVLIPKRALAEVIKFAGNEVVITQDLNHLKFESGDRSLIARKLALNFPNYRAALPKDNTIEVEFDATEMVKSLKRNAIMADERSSGIKIVIETSKMTLSAASVGAAVSGESEEIVRCTTKNLPKEGLTFHANWVYLVEYLNICDKPVFKLKDGVSAIEAIDGSSTYIVMPLRPTGS